MEFPVNKTDQINALLRLQQLTDQWEQFPGSQPGGSGLTGLGRTGTARDWSRMQNANIEGLNTLRGMSNQGPLQVRSAPSVKRVLPSPYAGSFVERYQQSGGHDSEAQGDFVDTYRPRNLYEQKAIDHLRKWRT